MLGTRILTGQVFHGAYMDIQWLQRDLGLYINGLFDTFFPCELLGFPQRSLAYLLKRFVDFDADKKYQMADWRIRYGLKTRPLTHFANESQAAPSGDVLLCPLRYALSPLRL